MGLKNWEKQTQTDYKPTEDHISNMSQAMDSLCEKLSDDASDFKKEVFWEEFKKYIIGNNRLLYTNVTNKIFNNYEIIGTFQTNLESVIVYSYENVPKENKNDHARAQRALMKLWDHINLAIRQYELFNLSDEHYAAIAEEKMKDVEIRLTKEMNMQLISLIAIFTALSFIVFGGISSLDNIFLGAKDIPVTKLMIVGTIWCFCIMNLVFIFMFFIAKLTELNIKSTSDVNANWVQRYPMVWWCNFVLISVLILSSWAYYAKRENITVGIYSILSKNFDLYFLFGTATIILVIVFGAIRLYKLSKSNK